MLIDIYCLRHGEPELRECLLGQTDCLLTQKGKLDMQRKVKRLTGIDEVHSSPLRRCMAFAQDYASHTAIPCFSVENLQECDFGDWDGMAFSTLYQLYPDAMETYWTTPHHRPPHGENLSDFVHRVDLGFQSLLESNFATMRRQHSDHRRVLLVSHGGVIRTLAALITGIPTLNGNYLRQLAVDYASLTHLSVYCDDKQRRWTTLHRLNQ